MKTRANLHVEEMLCPRLRYATLRSGILRGICSRSWPGHQQQRDHVIRRLARAYTGTYLTGYFNMHMRIYGYMWHALTQARLTYSITRSCTQIHRHFEGCAIGSTSFLIMFFRWQLLIINWRSSAKVTQANPRNTQNRKRELSKTTHLGIPVSQDERNASFCFFIPLFISSLNVKYPLLHNPISTITSGCTGLTFPMPVHTKPLLEKMWSSMSYHTSRENACPRNASETNICLQMMTLSNTKTEERWHCCDVLGKHSCYI